MTVPLVIFLSAAIIPAFFGRHRSAPAWLCLQALALGWIRLGHHDALSLHAVVALLEVIVVRAVIAPALLHRAILLREEPNLGLMPSNLFVWAFAAALIVLAFEFGALAMTDQEALVLGVVGATVAIAVLLLATNNSPSVQLLAVLFMENTLALFETLLPKPFPLPVHGTLSVIYLLTVGMGSWLIGVRPASSDTVVAADSEDRA